MLRFGFFWQFLFATGTVLLSVAGVLGFVVVRLTEENEWRHVEEDLQVKSALVAQTIAELPEGTSFETLQQKLERLRQPIHVEVDLFTGDGTPLGVVPHDSSEQAMVSSQTPVSAMAMRMAYDPKRRMDTLFLDRRISVNGESMLVRTAIPALKMQENIACIRAQVWTAVGITAAIGLALATGFGRWIVKPLKQLALSAERIAAGEYGRKVFAEGGSEVGVLARSFNDTSERLATQFAQRDEDRELLRAVLSSMEEGVIAVDADQNVLFANSRAGQLLDFEVPKVLGQRLWEVVRQRSIHDAARAVLAGESSHREELNRAGPNTRSLVLHARPLPGMPPRGAVLVLHDTTELRRLERIRQDFVANVSHELKTPLTVIKANVETLLDGAADDIQHRDRFLKRIAEQAERLHNLMMDLLVLARIEAGAGSFDLQPVPLDRIVRDCLQRYNSLAESKRQQIAIDVSDPSISVWADEEAVSQILDNLIDNAIKYTPEGGCIRIRWWAEESQAVLEVEDTGVGIPESELARIFERFYRVDKARSRALGGTGLGLSIVKHLAQAMNGTVTAKSILSEGSTFTVRLPKLM